MATEKSSLPLEQTETSPLDWQSGKTLSECLHHDFTSGTVSDVTFLVGEDKKKITAHKLILISRSPVFYAMLEGPLAEKEEISIPDIKDIIFLSFLGYLYTDEIDLTLKNVVPVLSAAMKYCVDILISVCEDFIIHNLSVDNVCIFLEESHVFHIDKLRADCFQLIYNSAPSSLLSQPFTALCASCMKSVLESDQLDAKESDVYLAITKWAGEECSRQNLEANNDNKRQILGDKIFLTRFNRMEMDFLLRQVFLDGILTSDLAADVVNYQMHKNIAPGSKLTCRPRAYLRKTKVWQCSDSSIKPLNTVGFPSPKAVSISFSISCRAVFHGIGSLVTFREKSTCDVNVYQKGKLLTTETKLPFVNKSQHVGEIVFAKPLFLTAETQYTVTEMPSAGHRCSYTRTPSDWPLITFIHSNGWGAEAGIPYLILTPLDDYGCKKSGAIQKRIDRALKYKTSRNLFLL